MNDAQGREPAEPTGGGEPDPAEFSGVALGRLARVFTEPMKAFSEIAAAPTWVLPLLVMALLALAVQFVIVPRIDFEATMRQAMEERSSSGRELSDEQVDRIVATQRKVARVMGYAAPLTTALVFLLLGGAYFLTMKLFGSEAEFGRVFSAVLHASLPATVTKTAILGVVAAQRESFAAQELEQLVRSSVGAWLDPATSKPLLALANGIDLFNAWQWVLLVIGLSAAGRISRVKAAWVVAVLWGVWLGGKAALAALF
ncbi:MAG: YIP1 family protein [Acidobacteriota bacterium]